jgi:hypothetical protein
VIGTRMCVKRDERTHSSKACEMISAGKSVGTPSAYPVRKKPADSTTSQQDERRIRRSLAKRTHDKDPTGHTLEEGRRYSPVA